ncbi:hypothetical protein [Kocuria rhizophila]|uniref:hypothetical protein n=1 Tax=Kocuria rhizophila TaxID=72000 RepID=UPI003D6E1ED8
MGAFLGTLGSLVELSQFAEEQSVDTGGQPSMFQALDGTRTMYVAPTYAMVLREWSVSMTDARPEQAAAFQAMCMGAAGFGPFLFVDPLAQVTNLLTPRQSLVNPGTFLSTQANPARLTIPVLGSMPALRIIGSALQLGTGTPVIPGRPVSALVWVKSAANIDVSIQFADVQGTWLTSPSARVTAPSAGAWATVSGVPGPGAAQAYIRVSATAPTDVAAPAITWTRGSPPWAPGRGARQVGIHGLKETYRQASPSDPGKRRLTYSATITEVGNGA